MFFSRMYKNLTVRWRFNWYFFPILLDTVKNQGVIGNKQRKRLFGTIIAVIITNVFFVMNGILKNV